LEIPYTLPFSIMLRM